MKNDAHIRYDGQNGTMPPCPPVPSPASQAEKLRELLLDIVDEKLAEIIVTTLTEDATDEEIPSALAVWGLKEEVDQMSEYAEEAAASAAAAAESAEDAQTAEDNAEDAAAAAASSATAADASADAAAGSATAAGNSATAAAASATLASSAKIAAQAAQAAAEAAVQDAEAAGAEQIELIEAAGASERESLSGYATRAETAAENAEASAESIQGSVSDAAEYATAAGESATAAAASATQAVTAKTAAQTAKTAAETAQAAAEAAQGEAEAAATAAETAQEAAEAAQTAAESAQSDAEDAATAAGESATAAGNSATYAENKATAAENAATVAENKATLAGESATAAAASAAAAEAAATDVLNKATVVTDTASGTIASFPDGADEPIKQITVGIEPQQDLHGYENPWPAGGGKNIRSGIDLANDIQNRIASATIDTTNKTVSFAYNATETAGQYIPRNVTFKENTQYTFIITVLNPSAARANLCIAYTDGTISNFPDLSAANAKETVTVNSTANKTVRSLAIRKQGGSSTIYYDESGIFEGANQSWSPYSNICPITGWNGATVTGAGKNLWNNDWYNGLTQITDTSSAFYGYYGGSIKNWYNAMWDTTNRFIPKGASQMTVTAELGNVASNGSFKFQINFKYIDGSTSSSGNITLSALGKRTVTYTSTAGKTVTGFVIYTTAGTSNQDGCIRNVMVSVDGSTDFEAPVRTSYPITWQSEAGIVYDGILTVEQDGTGTLVSDATYFDLGDLTWTKDGAVYYASRNDRDHIVNFALCSDYGYFGNTYYNTIKADILNGQFGLSSASSQKYIIVRNDKFTDAADAKSKLTGVKMCYQIVTPVTYTLTASQMQTLLGRNNWWADTGDIENIEYRADTKLYIDKKLAALLAALS